MIYEIIEEQFQKYILQCEDIEKYAFKRKEMTILDGVAYIHVNGMLIKNATEFDKELGCTDYDELMDDIEDAVEDGCRGVVFVFDSGGGHSTGSIEVARMIENLQVPSVAFVNSLCASAAYKIASACSYIVSSESANTGGIGSIIVMQDVSAYNKAIGVSYQVFTNRGAVLKSIGHGDSLTEEQKQHLQSTIDESGEAFQQFVLSNRSVDVEVFKGGTYSSAKSLQYGLIDDVGTINDVRNLFIQQPLI
jgi:ClpP class serine protease